MYAPPPGHTPIRGSVNALLEHFRWSVFPWTTEAVPVHLVAGGYDFFHSYEDLALAYATGHIHPSDGKAALLIMLAARLQKIQARLPPVTR
jgi:tyrosyl-tRNA synthetase